MTIEIDRETMNYISQLMGVVEDSMPDQTSAIPLYVSRVEISCDGQVAGHIVNGDFVYFTPGEWFGAPAETPSSDDEPVMTKGQINEVHNVASSQAMPYIAPGLTPQEIFAQGYNQAWNDLYRGLGLARPE